MYSNLPSVEKHSLGLETRGIKSALPAKVHSALTEDRKTKGQSLETESGAVKAITVKSKHTGGQW